MRLARAVRSNQLHTVVYTQHFEQLLQQSNKIWLILFDTLNKQILTSITESIITLSCLTLSKNKSNFFTVFFGICSLVNGSRILEVDVKVYSPSPETSKYST